MAYQYTQGLAQNTGDFLVKLQTFVVTTCGWTSIQSTITNGASGQYFAASSTGESGNDSNIIRFLRQNANQICALGYLSWAAGSGKVLAGSTSSTAGTGTYVTTDDNSPFYYWLFGSLDRIIIVTQAPSRLGFSDTLYIGSYTRARSNQFANNSNALTAGTNVVFNTTNTGIFTVGRRYTIADANNFESPKVTAISAGVSVTLDMLNNSYTTNARLGEDPRPLIVQVQNSSMGVAQTHWLVAPPMRASLNIAANTSALAAAEFVGRTVDQAMIERIGNPDGGPDGGGGTTANGVYDMWPIFIADESMVAGGYLGTLTEVFLVSRAMIATDDTITANGNTYHYINTAAMNTGTGTTAVGVAIRQA